MRFIYLILIVINLLVLSEAAVFAASPQGDAKERELPEAKVLRIGGDYTVESIERQKAGDFKVVFVAPDAVISSESSPKGENRDFDPYRKLIFFTQTLHFGVDVGKTYRISAEVIRQDSNVLTINQVVVFFKTDQGEAPVWMESSKNYGLNIKRFPTKRMLDMHAPQSDYLML